VDEEDHRKAVACELTGMPLPSPGCEPVTRLPIAPASSTTLLAKVLQPSFRANRMSCSRARRDLPMWPLVG
jgi:hypothetical protein